MKARKTILLTHRQIEKLIDMRSALRIAEDTFRAHGEGRTEMPAKIYIHLDRYNGDFRAMPAYVGGIDACGVKWVNVHPGNKRFGLPAVMAVIILSDPKTGSPLAVMDGTYITRLRTGAAGGVAAKHLADPRSSRVALVGCGAQARSQLAALGEIFKIKMISVYDHTSPNALAFLDEMRHIGISMKACSGVKECVEGADIVVTTTPSRRPIVKSDWIKKGAHINAIGADAKGKEELDPVLLGRSRIFVDDRTQAMHSGEINVPISGKIIGERDIQATLGEVITGKKRGRISKGDITIFDSTGLAIQDVAMASHVYKRAAAKPSSFSKIYFSN